MSKCFVIQPFDKGRYDKCYEDVFAPAIHDAGLEPYRVDRDPGVTIPIEESKLVFNLLRTVWPRSPQITRMFGLSSAMLSRANVRLFWSVRRNEFPIFRSTSNTVQS